MRPGASKVVVLLTDGRPEGDASGDCPNIEECARQAAEDAKSHNITIITLGVGEADTAMLEEVGTPHAWNLGAALILSALFMVG